jgi:hypothetical protein
MDEALAQHIAAQGLARLRRLRLIGLWLGFGLAAAGAWLGVGEYRLAGLARAEAREISRQENLTAVMDMKFLADTVYLAKIRRQALLNDIIGSPGTAQACAGQEDARGLPADHPCGLAWLESLDRVWQAAYPQGGPPIEDRLKRDPWGSPYFLAANEYGCGLVPAYPDWCPTDLVNSAGPDGRPGTADDLTEIVPNYLKIQK